MHTRLIVGYRCPFALRKDQSAYRIAGKGYKDPQTIYYLQTWQLVRGNKIKDFTVLQRGTLVFLTYRRDERRDQANGTRGQAASRSFLLPPPFAS